MRIYIVTPSFNQLDFLKRCVASVADQITEGLGRQAAGIGDSQLATNSSIRVHHHIQDGGSTDGTVDWLEHYVNEVCERGVGYEAMGLGEKDRLYTEHLQPNADDAGGPDAQCLMPNASLFGYTFSYESAPDKGMYDAINKGWLRGIEGVRHQASGVGREAAQTRTENCVGVEALGSVGVENGTSDLRLPIVHRSSPDTQCPTPSTEHPDGETILAHLNCDEQYLPGGLEKVALYFTAHPEADVVLADMIVVDNDGDYICHRRSLKPHASLSRICCVGMTTTTFHRASVVRDKQVLFDTSWRNIGDMVWYNALHRAGCRFSVYNEMVSVFVDTGQNLNLTEEAIRERKRYADEYLFGLRKITWLMSKSYSLRRWLKEFYIKPPRVYALYWNDLNRRDVHPIQRPTGLWHRKGPAQHS